MGKEGKVEATDIGCIGEYGLCSVEGHDVAHLCRQGYTEQSGARPEEVDTTGAPQLADEDSRAQVEWVGEKLEDVDDEF